MVQLAGKKINGCNAYRKCFETRDRQCAVKNDIINECIEKMVEEDGIIPDFPIYFADITPEIKALVDRAGYVSKANNDMLRQKVRASVIAVRRTGAIRCFDSLDHFSSSVR